MSERRTLRALFVFATAGVALAAGVSMFEPEAERTHPVTETQGRPSALPSDAPSPTRPDVIDVRSLLLEMVDLPRLSRAPEPPYVAHLASSYDRRSKTPSESEGWFANDDWVGPERRNYVRDETREGRREYVLLDAAGPGAIVRLWTATPTGTLRIYLDGATTPQLSARVDQLLAGPPPFPASLAYVAARGYNAYFPIPYRKSCQVTVDEIVATDPFQGGPLEKFYFQISYRTYPATLAERVRTFDRDELDRASSVAASVANIFEKPASVYVPSAERALVPFAGTADSAVLTLDATLEPGNTGATIREIAFRVPDVTDALLRRARLTLSFDDEPAIDVPFGDFFGGGEGLSPYESLPFSVGADGSFVSRWPMPFARTATVAVRGCPGIQGEASVERAAFDDRSLYFRAEWRPTERVKTRPFRDFPLIDVRGRGIFVGNALAIENPAGARWWGEGDEKIFVDGEPFPSIFGTGTEDYYGYAWSTPELFNRALHGQTRAEGPGFGGRFAMNRFHVLDAIPFSRALRFDLELWHWEDTTFAFSAMSYYYSRR